MNHWHKFLNVNSCFQCSPLARHCPPFFARCWFRKQWGRLQALRGESQNEAFVEWGTPQKSSNRSKIGHVAVLLVFSSNMGHVLWETMDKTAGVHSGGIWVFPNVVQRYPTGRHLLFSAAKFSHLRDLVANPRSICTRHFAVTKTIKNTMTPEKMRKTMETILKWFKIHKTGCRSWLSPSGIFWIW